MRRFRSSRLPRVATTLIALALFLTGTNYCLVGLLGANAGGAMACHALPAAERAADSAPACASHCGHAAPTRSPAPTHTPPCCIVATAVAAPVAEKPIVVHADVAALALATAAERFEAPAVHRALVLKDHSPPADPAPLAPLSSRAPPLS